MFLLLSLLGFLSVQFYRQICPDTACWRWTSGMEVNLRRRIITVPWPEGARRSCTTGWEETRIDSTAFTSVTQSVDVSIETTSLPASVSYFYLRHFNWYIVYLSFIWLSLSLTGTIKDKQRNIGYFSQNALSIISYSSLLQVWRSNVSISRRLDDVITNQHEVRHVSRGQWLYWGASVLLQRIC